jgi:peptidoglycan/LPS O-acetylase OafA/YrhL
MQAPSSVNPTGSAATTATAYRPEIDGLRAIAVLLVLLFHMGLGFPGGYVGVDVFFVISGFLITSIVVKQIRAGRFSMAGFYERRVRRLAPALIVTVAVTLFAGWFYALPDDYARLGQAVVAQPLMAGNLYHWRSSNYFAPDAETLPLLHTWSLAVEEQFYLVFPLLLLWLCQRRSGWLMPVLVVLCCVSLALGIWGTARFPKAAFYLLPTRAWEMLLGGLLALWPLRPDEDSPALRQFSSLMGLLAVAAAVAWFDAATPYPGVYALVPCLGAALFLRANQQELTQAGRVLTWYPLVYIGRISYSLYLIHWPLIVLYRYVHPEEPQLLQRIALAGVSLLLAMLSYHWVETPVRVGRWLRAPRQLYITAASAAALLLLAGVVLVRNEGFVARFGPEVVQYLAARASNEYYFNIKPEQVQSGELPVFGDETAPANCLIWGDSHAMALVPALDEACREAGMSGLQATHASTAPLLEFVSRGRWSLGKQSPEFNQAVVDTAIENEISTVVLAAYWLKYAHVAEFEESLVMTVEALVEAGIQVVLVRDVAEFAVDVPHALAQAARRGSDVSQVALSLDEHREKNRQCDEIFDRLAGDGVHIVDPAPYFVDESDYWRAVIDGTPMYRDRHHLTVEGALHLVPLFASFFAGDT